MNEYLLNFLRWITIGKIPDAILKKSYNWKIEGDKFTFNFKGKIYPGDWRMGYGSAKTKIKWTDVTNKLEW